MIKIFSHALKRQRYVLAFLEEERRSGQDLVIGWGHKPTADKARAWAKENNVQYLGLEDGFLRSLDLGVSGERALSLVADRTGIYYDAKGPSDLETLIESEGWQTDELLAEAEALLEAIRANNLSKFNAAPDPPENLLADVPGPKVLVVDQTFNDASITLGLASAESFKRMLEQALKDFSPAQVIVKTHPDVMACKKKGYLAELTREKGVRLLAEPYSPMSLLRQVDAVYVVTSQLGFEALMLGKKVRCFGMPFYAGWGLTQDELSCPRRTKKRSFLEVFAAAYLRYARYVNPVTDKRCPALEIAGILAERRRQNGRNRGVHCCAGYRWWKKPYARAYLGSTGGETRFFKSVAEAAQAAARDGGEVVVWSSQAREQAQQICDAAGVSLARMEDGFIRSVGLGAMFNWPYSLVVDRQGIYYDPSRPSDLEDILNALPNHPDHDRLVARARAVRKFIQKNRLTKYNTGSAQTPPSLPSDKLIVLVPGQVEDDASVLRGGFGLGNLGLLKAAREARPDAFVIYKPHPDVDSGIRKGAVSEEETRPYADLLLRDYPMGELLERVDEVHTLTSQTGFEALLRGLSVVTYGGPFYAGWGITRDRQELPRRRARLNVDELVAGALLLYPSYYDWQTRQFCRAEDVCQRLLQPGGQIRGRVWAPAVHFLRRLWMEVWH